MPRKQLPPADEHEPHAELYRNATLHRQAIALKYELRRRLRPYVTEGGPAAQIVGRLQKQLHALGEASRTGRIRPQERKLLERGLLMETIARYLTSRGVCYPASHYTLKYGIPAARLRQAAKRGHLTTVPIGKSKHYLFADVERLWPEDLAP